MKKRNNKGFTLIELLIVVAIIGIIVAIAIPNLLNAIQRAKQKRTMGDMRTAGTAAEAYAVDFNHYPAAAGYTLPSGLTCPDCDDTSARPASGFNGQVTPTYVRLLPLTDGWNSFFLYGRHAHQDYGICSNGKDGAQTAPRLRRNDELQQRHHLRRRPVRSVPRGRAELIVLPLQPDPRAPSRGLFSFPGLESWRCKAAGRRDGRRSWAAPWGSRSRAFFSSAAPSRGACRLVAISPTSSGR